MYWYISLFHSLFFCTNHSFDLVNSALGVNTDTKGTNSGCNPALGQNHAVWISCTPTSQPEHWRSQWGLTALLALRNRQDRSKPPSPYTHNILLRVDRRKQQLNTTGLHPCEKFTLMSWKLCCDIGMHNRCHDACWETRVGWYFEYFTINSVTFFS